MSLFKQLARVRTAQKHLVDAREEVTVPAAALLARGYRYPLSTVGLAAGVGLVLARLDLHPMRVPGVQSLLGGGLAELLSQGTRWLGDLDLAALFGGTTAPDVGDAPDASPT